MNFKKFFIIVLGATGLLVVLFSLLFSTSSSSDRVISITAEQINKAGPEGYLLDKSAIYKLAESVDWNVTAPKNFALTIVADNVVFDGDQHLITQINTSCLDGWCIQVKEGVKNAQIKNVKCRAFSGGGVWVRANTCGCSIEKCSFANCGYAGNTVIKSNNWPENSRLISGQALFCDGRKNNPVLDMQVVDCTFAEIGILRAQPSILGRDCSAVVACHGRNIDIKGCTIDGCVGSESARAVSLVDIVNLQVDDLFITDVFSAGVADSIYTHDVDGEVKNSTRTAIVSRVPVRRIEHMLDVHVSYKEQVEVDAAYSIKANHLKGVVPQHKEQMQALFEEHKWREFRTLGRLVCHHADKRSKTTAIYGRWVELFCEKILNTKVKVVGAFANLYENGMVPLPAHRDQYKKWIVGLSFGGARTLEFIPDDPNGTSLSFLMESGDLFIFEPDVNNRYMHQMQEEPESKERRINLTYFIDILPGEDPNNLLKPPSKDARFFPSFEEALEVSRISN